MLANIQSNNIPTFILSSSLPCSSRHHRLHHQLHKSSSSPLSIPIAYDTTITPPSATMLSSPVTTVHNESLSPPEPPISVSRSVVWFRDGDLRLKDHPGLEAACEHTTNALGHLVVCTPSTTEDTIEAASRLQIELKARGSHLSIRWADGENETEADVVVTYLLEFGAQRVHVREDVESETRHIVNDVRSKLGNEVIVDSWIDDLREWCLTDYQLSNMPELFPEFLKWNLRSKSPILPSTSEFTPPVVIPYNDNDNDSDITMNALLQRVKECNVVPEWKTQFKSRYDEDAILTHAILDTDECFQLQKNEDETYGERQLKTYLRKSETENHLPDYGRSLSEIFKQGTLSPRRIRQIVINHENQHGRLFHLVFRDAAKLILDSLDAREFHTLLARRDIHTNATVDGVHEAKFWRWNGSLIRYVEEGMKSEGARNGIPPVLLIHGFGASSFHFGKSVHILKKKYHVFAIDLVGFGRSDKPPMQYTSAVWEALVWDFVRSVIGQRVYVAGNSIGGIFASGFGTDAYPILSAGICLINSAGPLTNAVKEASNTATTPGDRTKYVLKRWRWMRRLSGRFILKSLQGRVRRTLNIVYPTNPLGLDSKLPDEIMRASYDYGAVDVLSSGMIAPPTRSFETLLGSYTGPLLVFSGVLDPLGNVKGKTEGLRILYPKATIVTVEAGHCPHDEVADAFAEALTAWIEKSELNNDKTQQSKSSEPQRMESSGMFK